MQKTLTLLNPAGIIGALDPYTHKVNTASLSGEGKLELEGVRPLRMGAGGGVAVSITAGAHAHALRGGDITPTRTYGLALRVRTGGSLHTHPHTHTQIYTHTPRSQTLNQREIRGACSTILQGPPLLLTALFGAAHTHRHAAGAARRRWCWWCRGR
jgi:hypothetical protein